MINIIYDLNSYDRDYKFGYAHSLLYLSRCQSHFQFELSLGPLSIDNHIALCQMTSSTRSC